MKRLRAKPAPLPAPTVLGYHEAFERLDAIEIARTDLEATFHILSLMIGPGGERYEDFVPALRRHVTTDLAKLEAACKAAWKAILSPLSGEKTEGDAA